MYVNYAYEISSGDLKFLALLDAENGERTINRQSNAKYPGTNIREDSRGFCQIHRPDHREIVNDPRFFKDRKRQLEQCRKLYKGGTIFYGMANVPTTIKRFTTVKY